MSPTPDMEFSTVYFAVYILNALCATACTVARLNGIRGPGALSALLVASALFLLGHRVAVSGAGRARSPQFYVQLLLALLAVGMMAGGGSPGATALLYVVYSYQAFRQNSAYGVRIE